MRDDPAKFLDNREKGFVSIAPGHDRLPVTWQALQMSKRRVLPVTWTHNDWDDAGLSSPMAFQGVLHLEVITAIRVQEIGADEQEDDMSGVECLVDGLGTIRSGEDLLIRPFFN